MMRYRLLLTLLAVFSPAAQGLQTQSGDWDSEINPGLGMAAAFVQDGPELYLSLECTPTRPEIDLRLARRLSPEPTVSGVIFELDDQGTYALMLKPLAGNEGSYGSLALDHPLIQALRTARELQLRSATGATLASVGLSGSARAIDRMLDFCREPPDNPPDRP